jgi:hypothetical protein
MRSPAASTFFTKGPQVKEGCGVRYARTFVNAQHVSQARMPPPCSCLVRIMSPTVLPRRYVRSPQRTLRSHDRQRASRKLSAHVAALCSPCANHAPHCTAQAAAYATFARLSTRITLAVRACSHLVVALCASCPPLYFPGAARGGRDVRYARTIVNSHHLS